MKIWLRDMSKPTELCCSTVSHPKPCVLVRASTWLIKPLCHNTTPFGTPVVPLVKIMAAGSLARAIIASAGTFRFGRLPTSMMGKVDGRSSSLNSLDSISGRKECRRLAFLENHTNSPWWNLAIQWDVNVTEPHDRNQREDKASRSLLKDRYN